MADRRNPRVIKKGACCVTPSKRTPREFGKSFWSWNCLEQDITLRLPFGIDCINVDHLVSVTLLCQCERSHHHFSWLVLQSSLVDWIHVWVAELLCVVLHDCLVVDSCWWNISWFLYDECAWRMLSLAVYVTGLRQRTERVPKQTVQKQGEHSISTRAGHTFSGGGLLPRV